MARLVEVTIGNGQYTVKTDADESHIQAIARYVNAKIEEVQSKTRSVSTINVVILAALNTADELFREREKNQRLMEEIEDRSTDLIARIEEHI